MFYYSSIKDDGVVEEKLSQLTEQYPTRGFETYYRKIRMQGLIWNRKRVLRIYRKMNLKMRRKHKRRLPLRIKESLVVPDKMNETCSIDFMSDTLENGRRFRVLNVMDDHNREALVNEAHYSIPAKRLVKSLEQLMHFRLKPNKIRTDDGPEFISKTFVEFCVKNKI